ncbi:MAG: hypothetical protein ACT6Q9_08245 [Polaromonas sp.]|uniref:hypothetical protein n=1 Tax=Polaromonas sp. TaxID=1869339 RepID=UPI0040361D33
MSDACPRRPAGLARGMRFALLALALHTTPAWASDSAAPLAPAGPGPASAAPAGPAPGQPTVAPRRADLGQERASAQVSQLADWVVDSRDNQDMPFMIIDKIGARVLMFDHTGRLQGSAAALLGLAPGDDSTPGIGERPLSGILPAERTTPAGRFVASLDHDTRGQELLWVDYNTALALHRVVKGTPSEQRAQRLDSATPADNRVSYGCINVPAAFYDRFVSPAFQTTSGVVYILPETRTAQQVFGSYLVGDTQAANAAAR